ncbi:hypothetical protein MAIT1_00893 [Magnetofaba australis IT-1]|uniref:Secondary thiamine-phosphate synthase enzyme n=1 Tax=Magnetofaba australis IT-1 TaxID=1434232 RepID=A0A1Y2JZV3_9PROT|nr:hypothetical protein MAIT1_00893 [Magnetofaba australis IT-1]
MKIPTPKAQCFVDITDEVARVVAQSGVKEGVCHLFIPHTTAGVTLNENCDPDVQRDMLKILESVVPTHGDYRHAEGNSHSHVKASLMGASQTLIITEGRIVIGRWQGIYLAEFDGPRTRQTVIKIVTD